METGNKYIPDMGATTSRIFSGEYTSETNKEMYAETADFFATQIKNRLPNSKTYSLADIGSYQGELMSELLQKLPEYKFTTLAVDINPTALAHNISDQKILSPAQTLPIKDRSIDIAIMRYVLQWNTPEGQKRILKEIARSIKEFALIEHVGADTVNTQDWRINTEKLFSGHEVPKMKRLNYYFSSRDEIEHWLGAADIHFELLRDRTIQNGADVYIERYDLNEEESVKTKTILGNKNYFQQTDWIIYPS